MTGEKLVIEYPAQGIGYMVPRYGVYRYIGTKVRSFVQGFDQLDDAKRAFPDAELEIHPIPAKVLDGYRPFHAVSCPARRGWHTDDCTCGGLTAPIYEEETKKG